MSLKSSPTRYGSVAIALHWLTAIAIVVLLATGLAAANTADAGAELTLLRGHAVMGAVVGVLTVLRIVWWLLIDRRPAPAAGLSQGQVRAARMVHLGLYVAIVIMVSSGVGTLMLSGGPGQLLGAVPLADFTLVPPFTVHAILSRLLAVLALGHVAAALWHQFVSRDRLLARMGVG